MSNLPEYPQIWDQQCSIFIRNTNSQYLPLPSAQSGQFKDNGNSTNLFSVPTVWFGPHEINNQTYPHFRCQYSEISTLTLLSLGQSHLIKGKYPLYLLFLGQLTSNKETQIQQIISKRHIDKTQHHWLNIVSAIEWLSLDKDHWKRIGNLSRFCSRHIWFVKFSHDSKS